jgi:hypothetical protein
MRRAERPHLMMDTSPHIVRILDLLPVDMSQTTGAWQAGRKRALKREYYIYYSKSINIILPSEGCQSLPLCELQLPSSVSTIKSSMT